MPNQQGLALLVHMYVTGSSVHLQRRSILARPSDRHQPVDHQLVLAMVDLEYLEPSGCLSYVLSEKGMRLAAHPVQRSEQGTFWALSSEYGRKIHNWREYLVQGRFREYESACGLARLEVFQRDRFAGAFCEACLRNSIPRVSNGPADQPA